jgi:CRISPR type I-E-associated protein CasB/Cse2
MVDETLQSSTKDSVGRARASIYRSSLSWWSDLTDKKRGDPGARARLRRSRSTGEALGESSALALLRRLQRIDYGIPSRQAVDLARVLVHVKDHKSIPALRAAGWKSFPYDSADGNDASKRPLLSEVRFRRLMKAERDDDELVQSFIRLVRLLNGECNVGRLAEDFLQWGPERKELLAFEYYLSGKPHLSPTANTSEDTE